MNALGWVLVAVALVPAVPLLTLAVQGLLAQLPGRGVERGERGRVAVLIPAHNEALMIGDTLDALGPQLREGDRVLVVADNCTDETAALVRGRGDARVGVLERAHATERGKGYALAAGMGALEEDTPGVVVIVDADCDVRAGALDALARAVAGTGRPVQGLYLMDTPEDAGVGTLVSAFAFLVKNHVRPRGMHRIGQPVPLTGSGMAFPYGLLASRSLASGDIVEDMSLGVELIADGRGAVFLEDARVQGRLPAGEAASVTQRTRWEHGHLQTIGRFVPGLLKRGRLLPALDLAVPPLSLVVLASVALWVVLALVGALTKQWLGAAVLGGALGLAGLSLLLAWARFARAVVPAGALLAIPGYALRKVPIYLGFVKGRETEWVRTERDGEA